MNEHAQKIQLTASGADEGQRADVFLARRLGISRSRTTALCRQGAVLREGRKVKASAPVRAGDVFSLPEPEKYPRGLRAEAERIPLEVVYEDEFLLVVDKPASMVVHPAPGHHSGTLVNALLGHFQGQPDIRLDQLRPGIVHRLDKGTSGLLVVAKTFEAHAALADQIKRHRVSRKYLCLSWGHWPSPEGTIEEPIGRSPSNRKKMAVVHAGGRPASTSYRVLESFAVCELSGVRLKTGRTHQIRVHFAHRGHPVVGDALYGGRSIALRGFAGYQRPVIRDILGLLDRQALHAHELAFEHPETGEALVFRSKVPADLEALLAFLRKTGGSTQY